MQKVLKVFKRISMEIIVYYQLDKDEETLFILYSEMNLYLEMVITGVIYKHCY